MRTSRTHALPGKHWFSTLLALTATSAFLLWGCGSSLPPVRVDAPTETLAVLRGEWLGTYYGADTGRHGTIAFLLSSSPDSAFGDVVMEAQDHDWGRHDPNTAALRMNHTERIPVSFVRITDETIVGKLEPYADPDCGCTLTTVFRGEIKDDTMTGTFTSRHGMSGKVDEGSWSVKRRTSR